MILFSDMTLLSTIVAAFTPFLSFMAIMIFARAHPRVSAGLSVAAVTVSLGNALFLLSQHWHMAHPLQYTVNWLVSAELSLRFGFLLDPTSLLMLALVAFISFLIQVYSLGYMKGDPGFARYYAFQSLFAWAMMALCISSSMLQLYVFWELVGLSSYLLIGFWYEKFSATQAGKKAFVMTRLGDVSLFLGILLVLLNVGNLNILEMNNAEITARVSPVFMTFSALLIFGGIVGKSAQFPLLTWLPDAMEGPTPVSALLHSATMVAAGVFLFARLFPFFSHSESAMSVFLAIGTITMLMASTMAMVDRDIKKVWAYSTISQLGFMIMALGAGGYFAGTFHLTTHAGFKALLFLCSGVWIHLYETNDMFEISRRGGRGLKIPIVCIILAAASLSGLPPLSGFFSKEAIMGVLAGLHNPVWLLAGLLGAFLTPYYAFRPIFIILFPKDAGSLKPGGHTAQASGHETERNQSANYWAMAVPLLILGSMVVLLGFFQPQLEAFLLGEAQLGAHPEGHHAWLLYLSMAFVLSGAGLAWVEFGRKGSSQLGFAERIPPLKALFGQRWYLDHFYRIVLDYVVYRTFANLFTRNDHQVIDGGIDGFSRLTINGGRFLSHLQSGVLRHNFLVMFAVLTLVALYFFFA
jgi:NADH-quinone oxidoreductase subunit L